MGRSFHESHIGRSLSIYGKSRSISRQFLVSRHGFFAFLYSPEVLTKVRVFSVFREQAITSMKRTAIVLPLKLEIEKINKAPGEIEIH